MLKQWLVASGKLAIPAVLAMMVALPAAAQSRVAVVDLRQALFASNEARAFSEQLQREFSSSEQEVRAAQDEARKLQERLQKDGAMMNERERDRLNAEFQQKVQEFNTLRQNLDQAVNSRKQAFLEDARPDVDTAVKELMSEHNLDVILPTEAVVYIKPELNLTEQLLDKLNR